MGKRIKDITMTQQESFNKDYLLLVDKPDLVAGADWIEARAMKLGLLGNAYIQGSLNGINWHDKLTIGDTYIRFSTDGGANWTNLTTNVVGEGVFEYYSEAKVSDNIDVAANTAARHTHDNQSLLDNLVDTGDGSNFLTDDGTYFNVLGNLTENYIPVKGAATFEDSPIFVDGTSVKIGDITNNIEFEADGTIKFNGTSTIFDDVTYDAVSLQQTGPGVSISTTTSTVDFTTSANQSDYLFVNPQLSHSRKEGSTIYPHIHFIQTQNNIPNFALQYRWQVNGGVTTTAWTAVKCNTLAFTYTSGSLNQIAYVNGGIASPVGDGLSDILQFRIIRDTTNALGLSYGADPYTATVSVLQFDIHIEKNSIGSRTEYTK